jgi:glucokinase
MIGWRLVSDVGGSNARFARAYGNTLSDRRSYAVADHPSFYAALQRYLDEMGGAEGCDSAAIGVAGPVDGGHVKLTNAPWVIDARQTAPLLGGAPTEIVNDLQAVALALPFLAEQDLQPFGTATRASAARRAMLALNVGTGFGAAAVIPQRDGWVTCGSEPGHMILGAVNSEELGLIEDGGSVEDLLSGRGVQALYRRVAAEQGAAAQSDLGGADIFARAHADPLAAQTTRHFSRLLGRVAGDLVLATGAWGGVYLCGSVAQGWAGVGDMADFRASFERKSVMSERMRGVFTGVIKPDDIPLVGLTYLTVGGGIG